MNPKHSTLPSFDTLKELAKNNPDELETIRLSMTQEIITAAKSQEGKRRLEGLNFVIEMTRRKANNPMQCCLKLSQLMWDSAVTMAESTRK